MASGSPEHRASADAFYHEYHGHPPRLLRFLVDRFAAVDAAAGVAPSQRVTVYLAGDSSLDNKYWLLGGRAEPAVNGYELALAPPAAIPDIAHQLNRLLAADNAAAPVGAPRFRCVNTAVEESTLGVRVGALGGLLPQDRHLRDSIAPQDVLVVSVGGNDIALAPSCGTACAMGWLTCCACTANVRDGTAWGLGHFRAMFRDDLERYICDATARVRPKLVVPTMLYYLDEDASAESWANCVLRCIGYNRNPSHVQAVIDRTYLDGVAKVCVPGSVVAPLALSAALDGRDTRDYVARVEPSAAGGAKIAALLRRHIAAHYPRDAVLPPTGGSVC